MVINIYKKELRDRVEPTRKIAKGTSVEFTGVQFFVGKDIEHTSHGKYVDDDSSKVVFWFSDQYGRDTLLTAFTKAIEIVENWKPLGES